MSTRRYATIRDPGIDPGYDLPPEGYRFDEAEGWTAHPAPIHGEVCGDLREEGRVRVMWTISLIPEEPTS